MIQVVVDCANTARIAVNLALLAAVLVVQVVDLSLLAAVVIGQIDGSIRVSQ